MKEKWEEIYKESDIKKIQDIELESLKVFCKLCETLEIDFYLYGGTLLGAVKYSGFVPWDDDLDLALLRKDYDKLIKLGSSLLPEGYEMQHPLNNKVTPFTYIKFRKKDTIFVDYALHKVKMNHGVYFDIYPIDNLPDDDDELIAQHKRFLLLSRLFYYRQISRLSKPVSNSTDFFKSIVRFLMSVVLKLIPRKLFYPNMVRIMTKYNSADTRRQGNYYHPTPVNYFDGIEPAKIVKFEGMDLKIPRGFEVNLSNRYGDISVLPPESERYGHKAYIVKLD